MRISRIIFSRNFCKFLQLLLVIHLVFQLVYGLWDIYNSAGLQESTSWHRHWTRAVGWVSFALETREHQQTLLKNVNCSNYNKLVFESYWNALLNTSDIFILFIGYANTEWMIGQLRKNILVLHFSNDMYLDQSAISIKFKMVKIHNISKSMI